MYDILGDFIKEASKIQGGGQIPSKVRQPGTLAIAWDSARCGTGVQFSDNDTHVFLKEQSYVFRTVVANFGFDGGVNYWEIIADPKT